MARSVLAGAIETEAELLTVISNLETALAAMRRAKKAGLAANASRVHRSNNTGPRVYIPGGGYGGNDSFGPPESEDGG